MKWTLIFISLFIIFQPGLNAQRFSDKADSVLQKSLPENEHAVSVLVGKGDEIIYQKILGNADEGVKADNETIFRIGSVSKQFTAAAILKLVEMGKMSLDDPLIKYIQDFPQGESVTIHHLLTHTSGIRSYTDQPGFIEKVEQPVNHKELIGSIKSLGYEFEPGEQWKYNNSGYYILGYLVEQVSGMTYEKFLSKHFFKPAKMKNTGVYKNGATYKNEAVGYAYESGKISKALDWDMTWAGGAGNLYSTTRDLYNWNRQLFAGHLLTAGSLAKAHSNVVLNDGSDHPYGYGWGIGEYKGLKRIAHGGGLHGFLSYLAYYPEIDATVIVLTNSSPPKNIIPANLAEYLVKVFFKQYLKEEKEVAVDTSNYSKYIGKYEYPGGAVMTISRENDQLFAQLSGQSRYEVYPKGKHEFFWKVVDAQITFHLSGDGVADYAMHTQNGSQFKAPRMKEQHEVELDEGAFEKYTGEYSLQGKAVKVWEEEDKYYFQVEGQAAFQIFPGSDNKFFMKAIAVEVEFEQNKDKSPALIIYQGGQQFRAERK
ncbi:hypothetical protein GCM10009122_21240 [Fulvivirga kasyanovii]|uniref:Serine hydrolase n=1 Tax=Fulvivirga kasyanovii TaxID=396812 RepID=A0ABW9RUN7_9BACT|nr:serine hydrolase [Fulvivirga kasyanovii]MTI27902.1 serine hydrolase [Fulvivirga kasyanovii]